MLVREQVIKHGQVIIIYKLKLMQSNNNPVINTEI